MPTKMEKYVSCIIKTFLFHEDVKCEEIVDILQEENEYVKKNIGKIKKVLNDPRTSFRYIKEHPNMNWKWDVVTEKAGDFIAENPSLRWKWDVLTERSSKDFILKNLSLPWVLRKLKNNPNLSRKDVKEIVTAVLNGN